MNPSLCWCWVVSHLCNAIDTTGATNTTTTATTANTTTATTTTATATANTSDISLHNRNQPNISRNYSFVYKLIQ